MTLIYTLDLDLLLIMVSHMGALVASLPGSSAFSPSARVAVGRAQDALSAWATWALAWHQSRLRTNGRRCMYLFLVFVHLEFLSFARFPQAVL